MVRQHLDERYGSNAVYEGGLRVYTTLDMDLQQRGRARAREAARGARGASSSSRRRARTTSPAAAATAPAPSQQHAVPAGRAGRDRSAQRLRSAPVGGRDWNQSNFNRATQALRQPGSAFKPFVYTAAIDNGFQPDRHHRRRAGVVPRRRTASCTSRRTTTSKFRGPVTLRYALQQSINIPAIKLLRKVGTSLVASYARRMGIKSPIGQNLSLALGTQRGEPARADLGVRRVREPRHPQRAAVHRSRSRTRTATCSRRTRRARSRCCPRRPRRVMTSMLAERDGPRHRATRRARAGFTLPAAGKTGTMDDYMDAWFVGYMPSLVVRRVGRLRREEADRPGHDRRARGAADRGPTS